MPRMIEAHEHHTTLPTRAVGANARCGPRVYPRPRSTRRSARGHRPAVCWSASSRTRTTPRGRRRVIPPAMGQRSRRGPSGRKRGGQPGHQGQTRALVPLEEVDDRGPCQAPAVSPLSAPLAGRGSPAAPASGDRAAPVKPVVTEYQLHRLLCPACGVPTRAPMSLSGCRPGALGRACKPSWRCARARITCRSARPRRSWPTCSGFP